MSSIAENSEHTPLISQEQDGDCLLADGEASTNSSNSNRNLGRGQTLLNVLRILLTEFCERLTFFGTTANLVLFCKGVLKLDSPWPSTTTSLFIGSCYFTPLLGGWLADTYLGRFNTIYGFSLLYFVGTALLAAVSMPDDMLKKTFNTTARLVYFVLALVMIAFGTGGIKANVVLFGADQVQHDGPRAVQTFLNWFFWFISLGGLLAFTVVAGVQQSNVFYGYAIPVVTMLLVVVAFMSGRNKYLTKPPGGSHLSKVVKIIREAIRNRKQNTGGSWLDGARSRFGGTFNDVDVNDAVAVLKVIPIFIFFILFWVGASQTLTSIVIQSTFMRLKHGGFTVPAAMLSGLNIVSLLVLVPILDKVIFPLLDHFGIKFTPLRRVGVGFLTEAFAMFAAGVVEIKRREVWREGGICVQTVFNESLDASCLSIFWQVPQFLLTGSSEALAVIAGLEFAYSQAPEYLKGVIMALYLVTTGLGLYLASLVVIIVRSASNNDWYPEKDPNKGHMEYFFFLLGGLMIMTFLVFLYVAYSYKYKDSPKETKKARNVRDTGQYTDGDSSV